MTLQGDRQVTFHLPAGCVVYAAASAPSDDDSVSRSLASRPRLTDNTTMPSNTRQLEARIAQVEKELAEVRAALTGKQPTPWYEQIVGDFAGDKDFAEIVRLGRLIRRGKLKG
jgi:hypothetical protein